MLSETLHWATSASSWIANDFSLMEAFTWNVRRNSEKHTKQETVNDIFPVDIKRYRLKHTNSQEYKADEKVM